MRYVKWVVGALVLVVVLLVAAFFLVPADKIAALAASRFEAATGRVLTIGGPVRPSLFPVLGLSADNIAIANATWSKDPVMVKADALRIAVDFGSIFSGTPRIKGITLVNPDLLLEKSPDGRANWNFSTPGSVASEKASGPAPAGGGAPAFSLDKAQITGGKVTYRDDASGKEYVLSGLDLTTAIPSMTQPMKVAFSGQFGGQGLSGDLTLGELAPILAGKGAPLKLSATLGKSQMSFDGAYDPSAKAMLSGKVTADVPDTSAALAAIGQPGIDIPQGAGKAVTLKSAIAYSGSTLDATDLAVTLDKNALNGKASVDLSGEVPYITAALNGGNLDFSALAGGGGGKSSAPASKSAGWSKAPIGFTGLSAVNADVTLNAAAINLGTAKFGKSQISAHLKGGTLTTKLDNVQAYQGTLKGTATLTGGKSLSLGADMTATSVTLQSFMKDFFKFDKITGTGDVTVNVKAQGGSMYALMNAVNGKGSIKFGKGEILGFDLVGMMRNLGDAFAGSGASTIFDSITASFDIVNGVVNNVDLNFLAPLANAKGEGTIGLGNQTIDYRITPTLMKGAAAESGISVPIKITGTWAHPKFAPDLKALIDNNAAVKAAKDQLQQKANDAVNKAKDNAQKTIQDQLDKGLKSLLPGGG